MNNRKYRSKYHFRGIILGLLVVVTIPLTTAGCRNQEMSSIRATEIATDRLGLSDAQSQKIEPIVEDLFSELVLLIYVTCCYFLIRPGRIEKLALGFAASIFSDFWFYFKCPKFHCNFLFTSAMALFFMCFYGLFSLQIEKICYSILILYICNYSASHFFT